MAQTAPRELLADAVDQLAEISKTVVVKAVDSVVEPIAEEGARLAGSGIKLAGSGIKLAGEGVKLAGDGVKLAGEAVKMAEGALRKVLRARHAGGSAPPMGDPRNAGAPPNEERRDLPAAPNGGGQITPSGEPPESTPPSQSTPERKKR